MLLIIMELHQCRNQQRGLNDQAREGNYRYVPIITAGNVGNAGTAKIGWDFQKSRYTEVCW